ncbi:unnamed protein product [Coffea canephora]|uniref:Uncharacterized protein n=1 Tax=Coffea canephora TaxID=49390 RepID=A0A068URH6_COFCA|nr:unnamed protein product [Coffea canephora]
MIMIFGWRIITEELERWFSKPTRQRTSGFPALITIRLHVSLPNPTGVRALRWSWIGICRWIHLFTLFMIIFICNSNYCYYYVHYYWREIVWMRLFLLCFFYYYRR